ncbi:MAG: hypothetical protein V2A79_15530 [Planctomycetota bacterium]
MPERITGVKRTVYVSLGENASELEGMGYNVIDVFSLPRATDDEHRDYLLARLQGVTEGTIKAGPQDIRALELEMRAYGLLDKESKRLNVNVSLGPGDVDKMMGWQRSRHTLADNSTVQSAVREKRDVEKK